MLEAAQLETIPSQPANTPARIRLVMDDIDGEVLKVKAKEPEPRTYVKSLSGGPLLPWLDPGIMPSLYSRIGPL